VDALANLRAAMQAIAESKDAQGRLAAGQAANPIKENALNTVRQIARGFKPNGLDQAVQRLLREPIDRATPFIPTDIVPLTKEKANVALNALCKAYGFTFEKYPFRRSSQQDAAVEELSAWFAPEGGQLWKFRAEQLGELTVLENSQWKQKDPAQKPQVTPEMLGLLNRGQAIRDTFFAKGGAQPQFTYVLRPRLDTSFKASTVELEVDGQLHQWTTIFQKQFTWPAAAGTKPGAIARIRTDSVAYAFNSHGGPWGIFRMMADAEPRAARSSVVEWKYSRSGEQRDLIQPAPVRLEFAEFPNGVDIFQPQFFDGMRCPAREGALR
jgi:type VI protein secretion system component VasK